MKIEQNPEFQPITITQSPEFRPITITLHTKEAAEIFWSIMRSQANHSLIAERELLAKIFSDWFTAEAHL